MLLHTRQGGFGGGEVSPDLAYRADMGRHASWLKSCKNFFIKLTGAALNRAGTYFMGELESENVRLLPFVFSLKDACVAVLEPARARFYTSGGPVLDAQNAPYQIQTPYAGQDLPLLNYEQVGDVLYLACAGKAPKTLTRYDAADWRIEDYDFKEGPFLPLNPDMKGWLSKAKQNGETKVYLHSMTYNFTQQDVGNIFKLRCFFPAGSISKKLDDTAGATALKNEALCCGGAWRFKTAGTWSGKVILQYSEDGLTWRDYQTFSSADGGSNWNTEDAFSEVRFLRLDATGVTAWPCKLDLEALSFEYNVVGKVLAVDNEHKVLVNLQNLPNLALEHLETLSEFKQVQVPLLTDNASSPMLRLHMAGAHTSNYVSTDTANLWKMLDGNDASSVRVYAPQDGPNYTGWIFDKSYLCDGLSVSYDVPNWALKLELDVLAGDEWRRVGGPNPDYGVTNGYGKSEWAFAPQFIRGVRLVLQRRGGGSYNNHYINYRQISFKLFESAASGYVPQPLWEGAWSEKNGWPRCVASIQGRLAWGTLTRIDASKTDDLSNFGTSIPLQDDDAVSATVMGGGLNEVLHLIGGQKLTALTSAGEFVSESDVLTPKSPGMTKQGGRGASSVRPAVVGNRVIYVQTGGGVVRDMAYDWQGGGYDTADLTVCVRHFFDEKEVKAVCYQQSPHSLLWALLKSGQLYMCTYMKQEEMLAWSRFETDGKVLDVCVLPREDGDELWLAVQRAGKVCLEKMMPRRTDGAEQFYADCGRTSRNDEALNVHGGFEHLEGRKVWALADGRAYTDLQVKNGRITLPAPARVVHAGLGYEMELETLCPDAQLQDGTAGGRKKRPVGVLVAAVDSAGGYASAGGKSAPLRPLSAENAPGPVPQTETFEAYVALSANARASAGIKVGQNEPRALCVAALLPRYSLGDL